MSGVIGEMGGGVGVAGVVISTSLSSVRLMKLLYKCMHVLLKCIAR